MNLHLTGATQGQPYQPRFATYSGDLHRQPAALLSRPKGLYGWDPTAGLQAGLLPMHEVGPSTAQGAPRIQMPTQPSGQAQAQARGGGRRRGVGRRESSPRQNDNRSTIQNIGGLAVTQMLQLAGRASRRAIAAADYLSSAAVNASDAVLLQAQTRREELRSEHDEAHTAVRAAARTGGRLPDEFIPVYAVARLGEFTMDKVVQVSEWLSDRIEVSVHQPINKLDQRLNGSSRNR